MKLTVKTSTDLTITLDVSPDIELGNFKALCEYEVDLPAQEMVITHEGRCLTDNMKNLQSFGLKEGDVLWIQNNSPNAPNSLSQLPDLNIDFGAIRLPNATSPENTSSLSGAVENSSASLSQTGVGHRLRQELLNYPDQLVLLKENNPSFAHAILQGSEESPVLLLYKQIAEKYDNEKKRIRFMNGDTFDPKYQKLIAEKIRLKNVESNLVEAIEHHPEIFIKVTMLFIDCKVNGHPVRAFVDSGAQTTVMSEACAGRCDLLRLMDKEWGGCARGVGVQTILGRVHLGHIQIHDVFLQSSFTILKNQIFEVILGLDMLKRHQCCIDLNRNVLVIGTIDAEIPFLNENDL